jgi:hypothetical protein
VSAPCLLVLSGVAAAESPPLSIEGDATPWERVERQLDAEVVGRRGFYLQGGLAWGGCTGELCAQGIGAEAAPGLELGFGYRFGPLFALGLQLEVHRGEATGKGLACADDEGCSIRDGSTEWGTLGAAGRFHLLREGRLDPWAGFFAGWLSASAEADRRGTTASGRPEVTPVAGELSGAGIGVELGVAWLLTDRIGVGLSGRYTLASWTEACFESGREAGCGKSGSVRAPSGASVVTGHDLPDLWSLVCSVRTVL